MEHSGIDVRIVILQRGWIIVGEYRREGMFGSVRRGHVIRRWGTSHGIGELANGPTSETVLDPLNGEAEFHELTVVQTIRCDAEAWAKHLAEN